MKQLFKDLVNSPGKLFAALLMAAAVTLMLVFFVNFLFTSADVRTRRHEIQARQAVISGQVDVEAE